MCQLLFVLQVLCTATWKSSLLGWRRMTSLQTTVVIIHFLVIYLLWFFNQFLKCFVHILFDLTRSIVICMQRYTCIQQRGRRGEKHTVESSPGLCPWSSLWIFLNLCSSSLVLYVNVHDSSLLFIPLKMWCCRRNPNWSLWTRCLTSKRPRKRWRSYGTSKAQLGRQTPSPQDSTLLWWVHLFSVNSALAELYEVFITCSILELVFNMNPFVIV